LWESYGDEQLLPYLRNTGDKNQKYEETGETAYPLKWSDDKVKSVRSFKQCYNEVLKPKNKYINEKEQVESFFDGGGYEFLSALE